MNVSGITTKLHLAITGDGHVIEGIIKRYIESQGKEDTGQAKLEL